MCILAGMLKTPLAVLRRASTSPRLLDLAKRMGVRVQRLNAVEAGRSEASDEFLIRLAKEMGFRPEQVVSAYLEGRRAHLRAEAKAIEQRLSTLRSPHPARRKSA